MAEILLQVLTAAYAAAGAVAVIGYMPTIKDLWRHKKKSANTSSYAIWTACSGTGFLYSIFILPDLLFRIVSGINFTSSAAILLLCLTLKYRK
jgi:hypothetical protein